MSRRERGSFGEIRLTGTPTQMDSGYVCICLLRDKAKNILMASSDTDPSGESGPGWAKGALLIWTSAAPSTSVVYENQGDASAAVFNPTTSVYPYEIILTQDAMIVGDATNLGAELGPLVAGDIITFNAGVGTGVLNIGAGTCLAFDTATGTLVARNVASGDLLTNVSGDLSTVNIPAGSIPRGDSATSEIVAQALTTGDILTGDGTDVVVHNLPQGSLVINDGSGLADLAVGLGDVVTGDGTDVDLCSLATGDMLIGTAAGLVNLAMPNGSFPRGDSGSGDIVAQAVVSGDLITSDGTDVAVVNIPAGSIPRGDNATGNVVAQAIGLGELLTGDGTDVTVRAIAASEVVTVIAGTGEIGGITVMAGDVVTSNGTDIAVQPLGFRDVLIGTGAGFPIASLNIPQGNLMVGDGSGAGLGVKDMSPLGSLLTGDGTDVQVTTIDQGELPINLGAGIVPLAVGVVGDLVTSDGTDVTVSNIASGRVVVNQTTTPGIVGVALTDGDLLTGGVGGSAGDVIAVTIAPGEIVTTLNATGQVDGVAVGVGDIVTGNGTDVVVVNIDRGELPINLGAGIAPLAVTSGDIVTGDGNDIVVFGLPQGSLLTTDGPGNLTNVPVTLGDVVTGDGTDVVVSNITAGQVVVVQTTAPGIDGVTVGLGQVITKNVGGDIVSVDPMTLMGGSVVDPGRSGVGYFELVGAAADTQTVTIGTRVYEFETGGGVTPGNVVVDITADQSADAAIAALVAAVMGDGSREADVEVWAGNTDVSSGMTIVTLPAAVANLALAETCANGDVSGAATVGMAAADAKELYYGRYAVTAMDFTTLALAAGNEVAIGGLVTTTAPDLISVMVQTAAGAIKPLLATMTFRWQQIAAGNYVLLCEDAAGTLVATDLIAWCAAVVA